MNKYLLILKDEYIDMLNIRNKPKLDRCDLWHEVVQTAKKILKINLCKLYVFDIYTEKIEKQLEGVNFKKIQDKNGNFYYFLNIDDYIDYIKRYEEGRLYGKAYYEDPELYCNDKLIIEAISHESCVYFYISPEEKKLIENEINIKFEKNLKTDFYTKLDS